MYFTVIHHIEPNVSEHYKLKGLTARSAIKYHLKVNVKEVPADKPFDFEVLQDDYTQDNQSLYFKII